MVGVGSGHGSSLGPHVYRDYYFLASDLWFVDNVWLLVTFMLCAVCFAATYGGYG
jgi:hypothetical protein